MHNEDSTIIARYMADLATSRPLSYDEERRLSERIAAGDSRATEQLATANLRLVVATASRYTGRGIDMEDLISEGNIGLLKAAAKYDASKGRFSSYASPIIRRHMEQAIDALTGNTTATTQASEDDMPRRSSRKLSMDAPLGGRENVSLLSLLANPDALPADQLLADKMQMGTIQQALDTLNERERAIIAGFYGIGRDRMTMAEMGIEMGLKRERVRQIRDKATRKLRKALRNGTDQEA